MSAISDDKGGGGWKVNRESGAVGKAHGCVAGCDRGSECAG